MQFFLLFSSLFPIIIIILLGYGLKKTIFPKDHIWEGVEKITFTLLMPCLVIKEITSVKFDMIPLRASIMILAISIIIMICILVLFYPLYRQSKSSRSAYSSMFQTSTRLNFAVAISLFIGLGNQEGTALLAFSILFLVPFINITNVTMLSSVLSDGRISLTNLLKNIVKNPIIIGSLIGLTITLFHITIPPLGFSIISTLGDSSLGLILLTIGAGLNFSYLNRTSKEIFISVFMKLILMPFLVMMVGLMLGMEGKHLTNLVVIMAMPTAVNGYVLAREMGGDATLYANTASLQMMLSFLTLPAWIALSGLIILN